MDYFSAVDDLQPNEDSGAGMTGLLEFNSATYYMFVGLNLDLFNKNLGALDISQRRAVLDAFIRSSILSTPTARTASMNGSTRPAHVLGIVKDRGQLLQLSNAFETPVTATAGGGFIQPSIDALKSHYEAMKATYDGSPKLEVTIPEVNIDAFCQQVLDAALPLPQSAA